MLQALLNIIDIITYDMQAYTTVDERTMVNFPPPVPVATRTGESRVRAPRIVHGAKPRAFRILTDLVPRDRDLDFL